METRRDRGGETGPGPARRRSRAVMLIDTLVAAAFCTAGIYHFTQPNQAWRSGAIEVTCAVALVVAGYLLGRRKAVLVHVAVAAGITALGIRHVVLGGGWKSGTVEMALAVVLLGVAVVIYRRRPERL